MFFNLKKNEKYLLFIRVIMSTLKNTREANRLKDLQNLTRRKKATIYLQFLLDNGGLPRYSLVVFGWRTTRVYGKEDSWLARHHGVEYASVTIPEAFTDDHNDFSVALSDGRTLYQITINVDKVPLNDNFVRSS